MLKKKSIYYYLLFLFALVYADFAYSQTKVYQEDDLDNAYKEAAILENKGLTERIKQFPEAAKTINKKIALAVREKNYTEAVEQAKKMDEIHPNNSDIQHFIAKMYVKLGEKDLAKIAFEKGIELKSGNRWIYTNYASFLAENGELEKALTVLQEAKKIFPNWSITYNIIANIKMHQGKLNEAEKNYDLALLREPKSALIATNSGDLFHEQGKIEKALECYEKALSIQSDFVRAYLGMAELYYEKKNEEKMMEALNSCLAIHPQNLDALIFKRTYYIEKNRITDACIINKSISSIDQSLKDLTLSCY